MMTVLTLKSSRRDIGNYLVIITAGGTSRVTVTLSPSRRFSVGDIDLATLSLQWIVGYGKELIKL
jgi:hypothetical protein